jgi:lysophospholipase L1-like esterase
LSDRGPKITPGSRVLLVGDSLAVGMTPHFAELAKEQRLPLESLALTGSRIDQWAGSQKLAERLATFRPTLVVVSLGTNDEYMQGDAVGRQRPYLAELVGKVHASGAELAWVGPPTLPKPKSNGIASLIQEHVPREAYFHSETLGIPRGPDKLHPTAVGYAGWAGAIWRWLS